MIGDLIIDLPTDRGLRVLQLTTDTTKYNDLMQRAVILLLTSDRPELRMEDKTLLEWVAMSTTAGMGELSSICGQCADEIRTLLNEDDPVVDSVTIDVSGDRELQININIGLMDSDETISGEFII